MIGVDIIPVNKKELAHTVMEIESDFGPSPVWVKADFDKFRRGHYNKIRAIVSREDHETVLGFMCYTIMHKAEQVVISRIVFHDAVLEEPATLKAAIEALVEKTAKGHEVVAKIDMSYAVMCKTLSRAGMKPKTEPGTDTILFRGNFVHPEDKPVPQFNGVNRITKYFDSEQ